MPGESILIVEDERIVARDIEKRLKKLGYRVSASVASGEEALLQVAITLPDLILMDIQLKGTLDGIQTAEQIYASQGIPVVFLTAYADEDTLQRAKVTEPFGYIVKPFDERDLHAAVEVALRRRIAEAAIRVALEKEQELSELKSRFWSMVIHEFRNPLTCILSTAQLLELDDPRLTEERRHEYLSMIQNSVRVMNELMNDTLSIARAESSEMAFNPQPLDVEDFCYRLVEEMRFSVGSSRSIQLKVKGCSQTISLDQKLLWHILVNLLSNAIKYSPEDSTVTLEVICTEGTAIFKVKDAGIGIPPVDQERLFQPFHRATNVGKLPGTGLGLTLVKKCVDLHGGDIIVDSRVNAGTTFTVSLYALCAISPGRYS
ncbi:MAG: hybrid sensor histidine kinase/response regulator [Leptolyngbyaceae cyanobacterium SM2_3_12]|nr:hybrid sensor histidine kinase/response regulator [Leptolyngbyaceae cyanobacterium SM2_3_12]